MENGVLGIPDTLGEARHEQGTPSIPDPVPFCGWFPAGELAARGSGAWFKRLKCNILDCKKPGYNIGSYSLI